MTEFCELEIILLVERFVYLKKLIILFTFWFIQKQNHLQDILGLSNRRETYKNYLRIVLQNLLFYSAVPAYYFILKNFSSDSSVVCTVAPFFAGAIHFVIPLYKLVKYLITVSCISNCVFNKNRTHQSYSDIFQLKDQLFGDAMVLQQTKEDFQITTTLYSVNSHIHADETEKNTFKDIIALFRLFWKH